MAYTTEKNYTQSGSTNRDFNVTFPFLATTDLRVQKNGVTQTLTSDYTIVQSGGNTVVNFNTAPADTNTIRIFRDTDIDAMEATFAAGSSIRSTDLNTNNTQLLYAAQEFGTLKDDNSVSFSLGDKGDVTINSSSDWVINPNSIELSMMTNNSVDTNELVDECVTADKLANFAITSSELASNSVTNAKIATDAVTNVKIQDNSISTAKIQAGAVTPDKLSTSSASGFGFVPVGAIFWFSGVSAPTGYLKCNGDSIPNGTGTVQSKTANFSALYAIVGGNVPDLRGEFIRALDDGRNIDSGRNIRTSQVEQQKQHSHTASSNTAVDVTDPGHHHQIGYWGGSFGGSSGAQVFRVDNSASSVAPNDMIKSNTTGVDATATTTTTVTDAGVANGETRPRNVALLACIKY
jgi:microcystin-dependent protein